MQIQNKRKRKKIIHQGSSDADFEKKDFEENSE